MLPAGATCWEEGQSPRHGRESWHGQKFAISSTRMTPSPSGNRNLSGSAFSVPLFVRRWGTGLSWIFLIRLGRYTVSILTAFATTKPMKVRLIFPRESVQEWLRADVLPITGSPTKRVAPLPETPVMYFGG